MIDLPDLRHIRKVLCALTMLAMVSVPIGVTTAADNATMKGLLAFENRPAEGWRAVFVDENQAEFVSGPADAEGEYLAEVPAGMRYTLVAGIDTEGARHTLANPITQHVRVPGGNYVIAGLVVFVEDEVVVEPDVVEPGVVKPDVVKPEGLTLKQKRIIGYSVGSVGLVAAVILLLDDDDNPSPSGP